MKIQYCSDLHLEFPENLRLLNGKEPSLNAVGDVLVIAGDIGYLNDRTIPNLRLWKWISEHFRHVLMVAGNHEFYNNGDLTAQGDSWQRMLSLTLDITTIKWCILTIRISSSQHFGTGYRQLMNSMPNAV